MFFFLSCKANARVFVLLFCICSVIVCVVLCIEIVRTTTLPPGVNPIAVVKYIYIYIYIYILLAKTGHGPHSPQIRRLNFYAVSPSLTLF